MYIHNEEAIVTLMNNLLPTSHVQQNELASIRRCYEEQIVEPHNVHNDIYYITELHTNIVKSQQLKCVIVKSSWNDCLSADTSTQADLPH